MAEHFGWYTWQPPSHCQGEFSWRSNRPGFIPPRSVPSGRDQDGTPLYVGRAMHEGDLLPAKVKSHGNRAYVSYAGKEWVSHQFEILASHHIAWQFSHDGHIPSQAMVIGHTKDGEHLYAGRAYHNGSITIGKVQHSHKCLYIPYNGEEIPINEYEIMLLI